MLSDRQATEAQQRLASLDTPRVWSMLVTIFGDLAQAPTDRIEGVLLTRLTDAMGIKPEAVRVALHRLRNDNWIQSFKAGRTARHALTPYGRAQSSAASALIYAEAKDLPNGWQIVLVEANTSPLRTEMAAAGFVQIAPRLFIGHGDLRVSEEAMSFGADTPADWLRDQAIGVEVTRDYAKLLSVLQDMNTCLTRPGSLTPLEAAVLRCLVVHHWRRLVLRHPYLPPSLTGEGWQGHQCRAAVRHLLGQLPRPSLVEMLTEC